MEYREDKATTGGRVNGPGRPLVFGEVLFDVMPDASRVLGGAPFNVAWHLEAFGLRPLMITKVGSDESGDEVLSAMDSWGMDTSGVQRDDAHPTGKVQVELDDGEPTFHILADQAYDHIDADLALRSTAGHAFSLLYHGSLISRAGLSRDALEGLRNQPGLPVFVDVNLRDPWWSREDVVRAIQSATWVKLNQFELELIAGSADVAAAEKLRCGLRLDTVIVTRGGRGALVVAARGAFESAPPNEVQIVDTVGAGDAFSAVCILGLTRGWTTDLILARALEFAAAMCTVTGATVKDQGFYSRFRNEGWW